MKAKATITNANCATDIEKLAKILPNYELHNYETRESSKGVGVLYIRLKRTTPSTQLKLA